MDNNNSFNESGLLLAKENLKIALPYIVECLTVYKKCLLEQQIFSESEIEKLLINYQTTLLNSGKE